MRSLLLLAACIAAWPLVPAAGRTLDAVRQSGTLRIGTTGDYKPFSFRAPDGSYHGADIAMAEDLARSLGVKAEFVPTAWPRLNEDFAADRFDIAVGGVTVLPAREKIAAFSPVILVDGKRPVVRCADRDRLNSVAALDQPATRLVVNPGASNEQFARTSLPHASLTVFPDNVTVFDEIAANRQDAMVTDGIEVDHQALLHPGVLCAASVAAPFTRLEKAYMLPKDPAFVSAVSAWWAQEVSSGGWARALDKAQHEP